MDPIDALATCFRKFITFSGRAQRSEFWWFALFGVVGFGALSAGDALIFGTDAQGQPDPFLSAGFLLIVTVPTLAVSWRRLHDSGRSGWWAMMPPALNLAMVAMALLAIGGFELIADTSNATLFTLSIYAGLAAIALAGLLQLASFGLLIWMLARPSDTGDNRYGPPPG